MMRFFRRKKSSPAARGFSPICSHCRSTHTRVLTYPGSGQPDHVKAWRGQRYITCKCLDCGREFYVEEPPEGVTEEALSDNSLIDNEEELRAAEEELKREIEDENDRRFG